MRRENPTRLDQFQVVYCEASIVGKLVEKTITCGIFLVDMSISYLSNGRTIDTKNTPILKNIVAAEATSLTNKSTSLASEVMAAQ